jgi:hypothetical protein
MSEDRKASALPPEVLNEIVRRALLEVAKMQDLEERAEEVAERTAKLACPYPSSSTEDYQSRGSSEAG